MYVQYFSGSDMMLFSIIVTAMVIIHISFHMYMYILYAAWKIPSNNKQVGDEGYLKLQIGRGEINIDTVIISFAHTASIMQPHCSSNDFVTRVHNNNIIAHAMPMRTHDVTLLVLAWRIEVRLTFWIFNGGLCTLGKCWNTEKLRERVYR